MVNPATGRSPHKKRATKPIYIATYHVNTVSDAERERVRKEFAASGSKLVWVKYSETPPRIERM